MIHQRFNKQWKILCTSLFLSAFLLRIFLAFWSFQFRENTDVMRYRDWARIAFLYGPGDSYKTDHVSFGTLPNNQPPGTVYVLGAMYSLQIQIAKIYLRLTHQSPGSVQFINYQLSSFFLRLPSILADCLIGVILYQFLVHQQRIRALLASALFLFNPVVLYNSSIWGQMDAVNTLFLMLSLHCFYRKLYFASVLSFFLSLYVKLTFAPFLFVFYPLLFVTVKRKWRLVLYTVGSIALVLFFTSLISSQLLWFPMFIWHSAAGEMQNITVFAFNFWWMIFKPYIEIGKLTDMFSFAEVRLVDAPLANAIYWGLPLWSWATLLFTFFLLPVMVKIFRKNVHSLDSLLAVFSIISLLFFLFLPRMHERYLYAFFPLFTAFAARSVRSFLLYAGLSLLYFINLYLVWHPMIISFFPYLWMSSRTLQWASSIGMVILGSIVYWKCIKCLYST